MARAWLLRMKPHGDDRVPDALRTGRIMIGWGKAEGLTDAMLSRTSFRDEVIRAYHSGDRDQRASGRATGQLSRFLRGMTPGDIVLVPDGPQVHVARVTGGTTHDSLPEEEHHAYTRPVEWLTGSTGVARGSLPANLRSTLRYQDTCIDVTRHLATIHEAIPETR